MGTQSSSSMLGSAVSSSTPNDFQPNSPLGVLGSCPLLHLPPSSRCPRACAAVGMQRALDSAIGLPRRSTSASRMLLFLIPADVRRSFTLPPRVITAGERFGPRADPYALETRKPPKTHRLPPDPALGLRRLILRRVLRLRTGANEERAAAYRNRVGGAPPLQGGARSSRMPLLKPKPPGCRDVGSRSWGQVEGRSSDGRTQPRQQKRPFAGLL